MFTFLVLREKMSLSNHTNTDSTIGLLLTVPDGDRVSRLDEYQDAGDERHDSQDGAADSDPAEGADGEQD